jgi:hypothetical protein
MQMNGVIYNALGPKMFGVGDFWLETTIIINILPILATQD